jgi:tRNA-uridine 2-sulfurtransferase
MATMNRLMAATNNPPARILVGMSGGVDSTVASLLLQRQGWQVEGFTLLLSDAGQSGLADAEAVCRQLAIPWHCCDERAAFRDTIIRYFVESYQSGQTPNPCVLCNQQVKFAILLREADRLGCRFVATGHYSKIVRVPGLTGEADDAVSGSRLALARSTQDQDWKDQSYFMYRLSQEQLSRIVFPLAGMNKAETRQIAADAGLLGKDGSDMASKPDSQDVCFVAGGDYATYIQEYLHNANLSAFYDAFASGPVVNRSGQQIGTHRGLIHYTIGQRKGFDVKTTDRLFVLAKDPISNSLIVGTHDQLMTNEITLGDLVYSGLAEIKGGEALEARVRSSAREVPCRVYSQESGQLKVVFDIPVAQPAPGQSCVFYRNGVIQAGGIIL